jgi:hypothetical protein
MDGSGSIGSKRNWIAYWRKRRNPTLTKYLAYLDIRREIVSEELKAYMTNIKERLACLKREQVTLENDLSKAQDVWRKMYEKPPSGLVDEDIFEKFRGLSVRNCLILMAEENGGILNVSDAKEMLMKAGRGKLNVSADVNRTLGFKRTDKKGVYIYQPSQPITKKENKS